MSKIFLMAILLMLSLTFAWDSCRVPLPNYTLFDAKFAIVEAGTETSCSAYSDEYNVLSSPTGNMSYLSTVSAGHPSIYVNTFCSYSYGCNNPPWTPPSPNSKSFSGATSIVLPSTSATLTISVLVQQGCGGSSCSSSADAAMMVSNGSDSFSVSESVSSGGTSSATNDTILSIIKTSTGWNISNGDTTLTSTTNTGLNISINGSATSSSNSVTSPGYANAIVTISWNLYLLSSNFTQPTCSNVDALVGDNGTCYEEANTILYNTKGFSSYLPSANASTYCKAILYSGTDIVLPLITYSPAIFAYSSFYNASTGANYLRNNSVHYIYDTVSNRWFLVPAMTCSNASAISTTQAYALSSASTGEAETKIVQIVVVDNIFRPLSNVSVLINQLVLSTNTTTSLGLFQTDSFGIITQSLPISTALFVFSVYGNSGLLQQFSAVAIPCSSSEVVCKLILVINPAQDVGYVNTFGSTSGSCNWDNVTGLVNCTSIGANISNTMLSVFHNNATGYELKCANSINSAGMVDCLINTSIASTCYNILLNATYYGGEKRTLVAGQICTDEKQSMGVIGIFAAFLLVCAFTGMGVYFGAPGALIGMASGLTMAALMGMMPPIMFPAVIVMDVVLAGVAAYLVRGA
jgi:hypothetical protein